MGQRDNLSEGLCCYVINAMAVSKGRKGLCHPMPLKSHSVLPLREVRARAEARPWRKECCLSAAPCVLLCLHSYTTQDHLAGMALLCSQWVGTYTSIKKIYPRSVCWSHVFSRWLSPVFTQTLAIVFIHSKVVLSCGFLKLKLWVVGAKCFFKYFFCRLLSWQPSSQVSELGEPGHLAYFQKRCPVRFAVCCWSLDQSYFIMGSGYWGLWKNEGSLEASYQVLLLTKTWRRSFKTIILKSKLIS